MEAKLKSLKIKTGVVKRTGKEKLSYRKEADKQKEKVEKMKKEDACPHDVNKMVECMQESLMMIPDCHRRLEKSMAELQAIVDAEKADLGETKEYEEALKVLEEAKEQLKAE